MQKNKILNRLIAATLLVACVMPVNAQITDGIKSSITTVNELLIIENAKVLAKERAEMPGASVSASKSQSTPLRMVTMTVDSIYGFSDAVRADIFLDGQRFEAVKSGTSLGQCIVKSIYNRCVALASQKAKVSAKQCPTACWTGISAAPITAMGVVAPLPTGQSPAPLPAGFILPAQR